MLIEFLYNGLNISIMKRKEGSYDDELCIKISFNCDIILQSEHLCDFLKLFIVKVVVLML